MKTCSVYYQGKTYWFQTEEKMEEFLQIKEEQALIEALGEEHFQLEKRQFITMPENMSVHEYRQWRKTLK